MTIEKIKKLLALAGNNPSEEEAQAAMLKAQELLLQNGLTMEEVTSHGEPAKKEVTEEKLDGRGPQPARSLLRTRRAEGGQG